MFGMFCLDITFPFGVGVPNFKSRACFHGTPSGISIDVAIYCKHGSPVCGECNIEV